MAKLYDENFSKSLMSFGKSFSRLNGQPLDDSSVYFSYEEAATYAASASAYVGQPIAVIDKENNTAKLYLIENTAGGLQEIGANVEFEDTNTTYSLSFTRQEETAEDYAGTIVKFVSSDESEENIEFFIPDSYDDSELVNRIDELEDKVSQKVDRVDVYTTTETDKKIGEAIAAADHLKRKIIETKEAIDITLPDAMQYIYMVPVGTTNDDNKYREYIVLEDKDGVRFIEQVGNWEVDLSGYLTEADAANKYATAERADELEDKVSQKVDRVDVYIISEADGKFIDNTKLATALEEYVTEQELSTTLNGYATKEEIPAVPTDYVSEAEFAERIANYETIKDAEEKYVAKEEGKSLISTADIAKLETVKENAEENYIKSVNVDRFTVTKAGELELNDLTDYVKVVDATSENGLRFINQIEIDKLSKLNLDDDQEITISGSVNASQVKELYATVANIVKGSTADLDPGTDGAQLGLGIQEGAEVNFINTVEAGIFKIETGDGKDRELQLLNLPFEKVEGLTAKFETIDTTFISHDDRLKALEAAMTWAEMK